MGDVGHDAGSMKEIVPTEPVTQVGGIKGGSAGLEVSGDQWERTHFNTCNSNLIQGQQKHIGQCNRLEQDI